MAYAIESADATGANSRQTLVVPKRDTLQSIIENFDPLLNRLDSVIGRVITCADRISGSQPQAAGTVEKNPEPNHLIWATQARRDRLARIVDVLEGEVSRVESGLA